MERYYWSSNIHDLFQLSESILGQNVCTLSEISENGCHFDFDLHLLAHFHASLGKKIERLFIINE